MSVRRRPQGQITSLPGRGELKKFNYRIFRPGWALEISAARRKLIESASTLDQGGVPFLLGTWGAGSAIPHKLYGVYSIYRAQGLTCPRSCPFRLDCYASVGTQVGADSLRTMGYLGPEKIGKGKKAPIVGRRWGPPLTYNLYEYVKGLPKGAWLRYFVSGDLLTPTGPIYSFPVGEGPEAAEAWGKKTFDGKKVVDARLVESIMQAHSERPDVVGWSYTHVWSLDAKELAGTKPLIMQMNNLPNLCWNASCENNKTVAKALTTGLPAVRVGGPERVMRLGTTRQVVSYRGMRWVEQVCPNFWEGTINGAGAVSLSQANLKSHPWLEQLGRANPRTPRASRPERRAAIPTITCLQCRLCIAKATDRHRIHQGLPIVVVLPVHHPSKSSYEAVAGRINPSAPRAPALTGGGGTSPCLWA